MNTIKILLTLLTPQEKKQLIPISFGVLAMSFLEILGIGSLGPFIALVADPTIIENQPIFQYIYNLPGFTTTNQFLIFLGVGSFLIIVVATFGKVVVLYVLHRYVGNCRYTLGLRLIKQYLFQPYSYFLDHNTSELSKNLLTEVDLVVNGVLRPILDLFAKGVLSLAIVGFLVVSNPYVALVAVVLFGFFYLIIIRALRNKINRYGLELRDSNLVRYKSTSEAFGAIKDVKILGKEYTFANVYAEGALRFAKNQANYQILAELPPYIIQAVAIGFGLGLIVVLIFIGGDLVTILPLIAIYGFAVQRLIPNLQAIVQSITQIRYHYHAVHALATDLNTPAHEKLCDMESNHNLVPYTFKNSIEIDSLVFKYPSSTDLVLRKLRLQINKNTTVGFVGSTGCGKTTLVDVIMGLLSPTSGCIRVDGEELGKEVPTRAWQRNFGYVPQQIYLSDDSLSANIAFGIPKHERNQEAIEKAARIANLHDLVISDLPMAYDTVIGERGIRLSGGQRQRVGIARALYHDPDILVMDEATSALDSITEEAVMDAIHNLMNTKTVILIAHRITTVQECDVIYLLEKGKINESGSYSDLLENSEKFRLMAKQKITQN